MRLSIITDEISQDLEHCLHVCRDLGVDTVELRTVEGMNIVFHDAESLRRIKKVLDREGFRVCVIASPFLKSHLWHDFYKYANQQFTDFDTPDMQWEILERSLVVAKLFNAPYVRTFSFWRVAQPMDVREIVRDIIAEAVRRTEAAGLKLVIENEHACNIATGEEVGWLFQHLDSPAFGAIWDPGNEAALGSSPFPEGYHHVRGRIFHVHLKDVSQDEEFVKMGTGIIDYVGQLRALREDGYDGVLSLETHYAHPEGGSEQATQESCVALQALCNQAGIVLAS